MSRNSEGAHSLGETKTPAFGSVLRQAIKLTFGTNREFALELGVSEGRISQVLSGTESITAQTLDQILNGFENLGVQERLHTAWVRTFAPSPVERLASVRPDIQAEQLLNGAQDLINSGRARIVLSQARSLLSKQLDAGTRAQLLRLATEVSLFIQRPSLATALSRQLVALGEGQVNPVWTAEGLYTAANASRVAYALPSRDLTTSHETAVQFISAWTAKDQEVALYREKLKRSLVRDRVLTMLLLHGRKQLSEAELLDVRALLDLLLIRVDEPTERAVTWEVKARLFVAIGDPFNAEEALEQATGWEFGVSTDYPAKTRVVGAQILMLRKEPDAARELLETALDECFEIDNLHHATVIERLLGNLRS